MSKIEKIKSIYSKEYFILIGVALLPLLWKVLEIGLLSSFDNSLKILGQTALLSIIFKIFEETLLNPLFKTLSNNISNKNEYNYIGKKFLIFYIITTSIFTLLVYIFINPIMTISMIPSYLFTQCFSFLKIYTIASGLNIIAKYLLTFNIISENTKKMFFYLLIKSILTSLLFIIIIPHIGVNGVAISELIINLIVIMYFLFTYPSIEKSDYTFNRKEYFKLTFLSFSETLIRNIVYYFVILVMINVLDNQDLYFVSNEYIWSIMLIPTLAQSTLIKQKIAKDNNESLVPYFYNSFVLIFVMIISLLLSPFVFKYLYQLENYLTYFITLIKLFPCYIIFVFDSIAEAYFISIGKLKYTLIQSILTNIGVYLSAFILYLFNVLPLTLDMVILLFNLGVIVSSTYTLLMYKNYKIKQKSLIN